MSHESLLGLNLINIFTLLLHELIELRSDEVGGGTSEDVISVDGGLELEVSELSVHCLFDFC